MNVIKRDGRKVEFDKNKIRNAMIKAYNSLSVVNDQENFEAFALKTAEEIESNCKDIDISVEKISDIVEKKLMASR